MPECHNQTTRRLRLLGLPALLVALFTAMLTFGASAELGYRYDGTLEKRMEALKAKGHACLPPSYPILTTPYVSRLVDSLYKSCVTDNASKEQIAKYAALGAGSLMGGAAYTVPYGTAEFASDSVKCVLKSFVNASSMTESDKEKYRDWVDTGAVAKDWFGFAGSIHGLAKASSEEVSKAFVDYAFSGTERIQDAGAFADAYNFLSRHLSVRGIKEMKWDASAVTLDEYDDFMAGCQYSRAHLALARAEEEADLECKALGHSYRVAEQELISKIANPLNLKVLAIDSTGLTETSRIILKSQEDLRLELEKADTKFLKHVEIFADIEKRKKELKALTLEFNQDRETYTQLYKDTLKALDTPHACYAITRLRQDVIRLLNPNHNSSSCYAELQKGGPAGGTLTPDSFAEALWQLKHKRLTLWWGEVDKIKTALHECKTSEAFAARDRLRSEIASNPVFEVVRGECVQADQAALQAALTDFVEPVTCKMTTVPKDIVGLSVSDAADKIRDAGLYLSGPFTIVVPKDGAKPNTVLDSLPAPGAPLRVWSPVTLTVYGDAPKEDPNAGLVDVPTVIGMNEEAANKALTAVGLVPAYADDIPADQEDMVPGNIHTASHIAGDKLPIGSAVTLTKIGPRPTVSVPSIAGAKTLAEAQAILAGAKLAVGAAVDGAPPPEGGKPGEFYATDPPVESPVEMFSSVTPIRYGPANNTTIAVPSLRGKNVKAAGEVLAGFGDHFVMGSIKLAPTRPAGTKLGHVAFTTPAAKQLVPAGTVVTLFLYPPLKEEIAGLREIPYGIIGIPASKAADILRGSDNFFIVPPSKDGDAAQEGQIQGTVQSATPAPGTFALRGSAVQLYVFKEAEQSVSLQACPNPNDDPSSLSHRHDTNNTPNDGTHLDCKYFEEGPLRTQIPKTDDEFDGVLLGFVNWPECGGINLTSKEIYDNGKRVKSWTYLCNARKGETYRQYEAIYSNGIQSSSTQWHPNGKKSSITQYDSKGRAARQNNYNESGEPTYCTQWDSNGGNPVRCK